MQGSKDEKINHGRNIYLVLVQSELTHHAHSLYIQPIKGSCSMLSYLASTLSAAEQRE